MQIGVIGVGAMGKNHIRIYSELKGIDEVCAYDLDSNLLKHTCEKFGITACDSLDAVLKKVNAVSICVPTKFHSTIAKKVMENNVSCLIEKPLASTVDEGNHLLEYAKNKDHLVIGVGHIERFNPIVNEIMGLAVAPRFIEIKRHNPASSRITDADVVSDLMIHDIDIVWNCLFNNKAFKLYSVGNADLQKTLIKFEDCIVSLSASRVACKKIRNIYVECDEFTIDGDFMTQEIYIYRKPGKYREENTKYTQENFIEKVLVNKVEPLREELKTFIECVRVGRPFPISLEQAFQNLKIAEEIRVASVKNNK